MCVLDEGDTTHLCFALGALKRIHFIYSLYARGPTAPTELQKTPGLTDSMPDLFRVMEPSMWLEFWTQGVGEDMFELPAGLKTLRPVALMPRFESFRLLSFA